MLPARDFNTSVHSTMWTTDLSPDLVTKCEVELGESEQRREDALELLKKMISEEPGFSPWTDEVFLLCFLRTKKFDVKRAFSTLRNFYAFKAHYSGYVTDLAPADVRRVLKMHNICLSPHTDREGGAVLTFQLGSIDLKAASVEEYFGTALFVGNTFFALQPMHVCGMSLVYDFSDMSLRHVAHFFKPSFIWMTARSLLNASPFRIRGIHAVSESPLLTRIYHTIIKPLFPKKLRDRVVLHGDDRSSLHTRIPRECLPESLGGTLTAKDYDLAIEHIEEIDARLDHLRRYTHNGKTYPLDLHSMWKK